MSSLPRSLLLPAVLYTGLNCVKPLTIDDAAYFYDARQIAHHPLDPYGHWILWYELPQPANTILAPPAFLYYWAPAVTLFGEQPVLWKLWLFPIALLFVWALHDLFVRFARGLEVPLTWLTVLSPAFLPGFNLMLDVPALALSLAAVALFFRAVVRDGIGLATLAGLVAGVAMQTKYTAVVAPGVMLLAALLWKKPRLWLPAAVVAAHVFVAWELVTAFLYGDSHFLLSLRVHSSADVDVWKRLGEKAVLVLPLLGNLGGVAPAVFLVALAGLRVPGRWLLVIAVGLAAVWFVVAGTDVRISGARLEDVQFIQCGAFGLVVLALAGVRAVRTRAGPEAWFLVSWLALETAAYFPLTPFPAVRRVMGVLVAATLLAGHLAARNSSAAPDRRKVRWAVGFGAVLGLLVWGVDLLEAWTHKYAAEHAAAVGRELAGPDRTVWYMGHWGFQHYAEAAGMQPLIGHYSPGPSLPEPSRLREGDIVVVPGYRVHRQELKLEDEKLEQVGGFELEDVVPLKTVWTYYSGLTPIKHQEGEPRLDVTLYRVKVDCELGW